MKEIKVEKRLKEKIFYYEYELNGEIVGGAEPFKKETILEDQLMLEQRLKSIGFEKITIEEVEK